MIVRKPEPNLAIGWADGGKTSRITAKSAQRARTNRLTASGIRIRLVDSGPVVFGIGAAATGLGLVAAAAVGDEETYQGLKSAEALVRSLGGERLNAVGDSILSVSIALSAEAQRARSRAPAVD